MIFLQLVKPDQTEVAGFGRGKGKKLNKNQQI